MKGTNYAGSEIIGQESTTNKLPTQRSPPETMIIALLGGTAVQDPGVNVNRPCNFEFTICDTVSNRAIACCC